MYWFTLALVFVVAIIAQKSVESWLTCRLHTEATSIFWGEITFFTLLMGFQAAHSIHEKPHLWQMYAIITPVCIIIFAIICTKLGLWLRNRIRNR